MNGMTRQDTGTTTMNTAMPKEVREIAAMLSWQRPAGSRTERRWIKEYLEPLGIERDKAGNIIKRIGDAPILWSSHTDTVHRDGGPQTVTYTPESGTIRLAPGQTAVCLGADDTAGVWLMMELIRAGKPGLYVFHRGEEVGGIGSSYIAEQTPELLTGIKAAIALDRRGYTNVITHQWSRCCSDAFAHSLAFQLGHGYKPDESGIFTDTANYTDLIGECTNLSVGYFAQHSKPETLDAGFLVQLRDTLLTLDYSKLDYSRQPGEVDPDESRSKNTSLRFRTKYVGQPYGGYDPWDDELNRRPTKSLERMVRDNPDEIVDLLRDWGYDATSLADELYQRGGAVRRWQIS